MAVVIYNRVDNSSDGLAKRLVEDIHRQKLMTTNPD
jgi:hypothetical protein